MNDQIRRVFTVTICLFAAVAVASTIIQFFAADALTADSRNSRRYLHSATEHRGPIIVDDEVIVSSTKEEDSSQYQRVYSQGELYAAVTGYFSASNLMSTGIEAAENEALQGDSAEFSWQSLVSLFTGNESTGGGVVLTLDPDIQQAAADALGDRKGAAVAIDVSTGAILALYSSPSYDPNQLASLDSTEASLAYSELLADSSNPLVNRAIAGDLYPPGSTFKLITAIAMLENGISPTDTLDSPVSITLPGTETTLSNIESTTCGNGTPTFQEAFARSCNTTFALASEDLTNEQIAEVAERFGFDQSLEIPLSVTASQFPEDTDAAQLAMSAIGQYEVQVTPLQMAMVAAAIANDGVLMTPYLVDSLVDADNQVQSQTEPTEFSTAMSAEVAEQLTSMMVDVVSKSYGTGQNAAVSGIQVAAKTGTAEWGTDGYTLAWTVAFGDVNADASERIAVAVVVEGDESDPTPHGGEVAGPIAAAMIEAGLQ